MNKIVIIPTFNEIENIEKIIRKVFSLSEGFHILIVDDGSPDGTAEVVKKLQGDYPNELFLMERKGKQGLGTAYIAGFKWSIQKKYDYIFEMDADFSHNPDDLMKLYASVHQDGNDVSIGSRYIKSGKVENWPLNRVFISYGASLYVRMITFMPIKDCTAGFVCYKREVLENIDLDKIRFIGYAFQIEMKYRAWRKGYKLKEIPITFVDRKEGHSKMTKGIVKEAIFGVWKMKFGV
ncbi:MAG: polyprenol monophosphomannose synthase [Bacteroidetes bacterium]|nr:polyprenol monophosphomannose synthase [Bacteroidota bacterium]MBP6316145.1 polyprenol monophosphomannose synthase [Chitinophagaceae bacterium]